MRAYVYYALVGLIGLLGATLALAEPAGQLTHESAFKQFESYKPIERQDWKSANDHVGKLGGWQYYAREANDPSTETNESSKLDGGGHRMERDIPNMKGMSMDHGMKHGAHPAGGKP